MLKQTSSTKVLLVQDTLNSCQNYIIKILRANNADKLELNNINNEVILLVSFILKHKTHLKNHSNVVSILDYFFQDNGRESYYYMLLEFCGSKGIFLV